MTPTTFYHETTKGNLSDDIRALCSEYYQKICSIENDKYDMEKEVEFKDYRVIITIINYYYFFCMFLVLNVKARSRK